MGNEEISSALFNNSDFCFSSSFVRSKLSPDSWTKLGLDSNISSENAYEQMLQLFRISLSPIRPERQNPRLTKKSVNH